MTSNNTFLPNYAESQQTAAEYLRQALPLMSANQVPTDPINYSIWYEYVSGNNVALTQAVNKMLASGEEFNSNTNQQLYQKYICDDRVETILGIKNNLLNLIEKTMSSVEVSEKKAQYASSNFSHNREKLDEVVDIVDIKNILNEIILETKELASTSNLLKRKLVETNQEVRALKEELILAKEKSQIDSLTGLLNRGAFEDEMSSILNQEQQDVQSSLIMIDLDHFKSVNDTYGHLIGDKVLKFTAQNLKQGIDNNCILGRVGGEEFAIIVNDVTEQNVIYMADKIREKIARSRLQRKNSSEPLRAITVSMGIAHLKSEDDQNSWFLRADKALYKAKNSGRNKIEVE